MNLKTLSSLTLETVTELVDKLHAFYSLTSTNADLVDATLVNLKECDFDVEKTYHTMTQHSLQDLLKADWTPEEIAAFEQSVISYGFDLRFVKRAVRNTFLLEFSTALTSFLGPIKNYEANSPLLL